MLSSCRFAVASVLDLKHAIQVKYKIATQHQVLVVNGGECMAAERRVCSYSAGTVSCPSFFNVVLELLPLSTPKQLIWLFFVVNNIYIYFTVLHWMSH